MDGREIRWELASLYADLHQADDGQQRPHDARDETEQSVPFIAGVTGRSETARHDKESVVQTYRKSRLQNI